MKKSVVGQAKSADAPRKFVDVQPYLPGSDPREKRELALQKIAGIVNKSLSKNVVVKIDPVPVISKKGNPKSSDKKEEAKKPISTPNITREIKDPRPSEKVPSPRVPKAPLSYLELDQKDAEEEARKQRAAQRAEQQVIQAERLLADQAAQRGRDAARGQGNRGAVRGRGRGAPANVALGGPGRGNGQGVRGNGQGVRGNGQGVRGNGQDNGQGVRGNGQGNGQGGPALVAQQPGAP